MFNPDWHLFIYLLITLKSTLLTALWKEIFLNENILRWPEPPPGDYAKVIILIISVWFRNQSLKYLITCALISIYGL